MFQTMLFWYATFAVVYISTFSASSEFKRFFFFSEAAWLSLFVCIVGANLLLSNPVLLSLAFFVLVFTACEAVLLAAMLLMAYESAPSESYISGKP